MRRLLLGLLGLLSLSACGTSSPVSESPEATPGDAVPQASSVPESLAFSAPRVGGGTVDVAAYAGKPLLFWFWAPT